MAGQSKAEVYELPVIIVNICQSLHKLIVIDKRGILSQDAHWDVIEQTVKNGYQCELASFLNQRICSEAQKYTILLTRFQPSVYLSVENLRCMGHVLEALL